MVSNSEIREADEEFTPDTYDDRYLNMELAVPRGDNPNPQYAKVMKRLRDAEGIPIVMSNENPILDSRMYEVEYQDGTKASLAANDIAENLLAQVDQEDNRHVLLDELIDYRGNGCEVKLQDAFITTGTGTRRRHETPIGWGLLAQWKVWEKEVVHIPPGYQQIKCHMIFDVKMGENFRRKARFVAGGPILLLYLETRS